MYYLNKVMHMIEPGDNLYRIAMQYNTTVEDIMMNNPHINPYNLVIGDMLIINPGYEPNISGYPNYYMPDMYNMTDKAMMTRTGKITKGEYDLNNKMRSVWGQHGTWTRSLIISIVDNLKDTEATTKRLLRNPRDLANIFKQFYGDRVADKIEELFKDHLVIADKLVKALKMGDNVSAGELNKKWYENADDIARELARINPKYDLAELKKMLHKHLELVTGIIKARLEQTYEQDVIITDRNEQELIGMADYLTRGIIKQFPRKFY